MKKSEDIKVFISHRDSKCDECGEELGRKAWITLEEGKGALCAWHAPNWSSWSFFLPEMRR
jgi:hypothetical protein